VLSLKLCSCFPFPLHTYFVFRLIDPKMVQLAITGLVGLLALLQPTLAAPQRNIGASDATTCVANGKLYHSGRSYKMFGASYVVRCAKDSTGRMTHSQSVARGGFTVCAETCERTNGCAGFSYVGSDEGGTCYFKADVGGWTTASDDLVSCWKDANNNGGEPEPVPSHRVNIRKGSPTSSLAVSGSASVSASASVPTSVHVSSTTATVPAPSHVGHCQQAVAAQGEVYRDGKGYSYKLTCGEDHNGGDLHAVKSKSFLGCTELCDANPECIGYAYTPGVCFLKRHLTGTEINAGVDFAINVDRNSTASTPVSTSTSAPGRMLTVTVTSYTSSAMPSTTSAPGGFLTPTSSATPSSHRTKQHGHHHFSKFMSVFYSKHSKHFGSYNHTKSAHHHNHHHYHTVTHNHTHNHTVSESHHTKSHHHHSHHTTPTEAVATAYVSQTYTQTNYVTSVSSSSISSDVPTSTYTKQPIKPTPVGDKVYCNELRNQKPKKLRTEVLKGEHRFHGLWVEDPTRGK
jgi:hypothetical protein